MAENDQQQAGAVAEGTTNNQGKFALQRLYIKDSSFESPNSPACFKQAYNPKVDFGISTKNIQIDAENNLYEVALKLTAEVKQDDKTVFLVEVEQAGIFEIAGFDDKDRMSMVMNVTCPTILFPYGREAIDALVIKGSFPALMLAPISFEAVFAQAQQQRAQQADAQQNAPAPVATDSH